MTALTPRRRTAVLATVCAAVLAINLDTTIVNVALPVALAQLRPAPRPLQWVVDAYDLAFAGLVLAAGAARDRFGRRPALIIGLVGFAAASAARSAGHLSRCAVATRFVMGAFAAAIFPTTLSIISNTFRSAGSARPPSASGARSWASASRPARSPAGAARALLLGERVLGAGAAGAGDRRGRRTSSSRESRDPDVPPLDLPGLGRFSIAMLVTLTYTIIEAPASGWSSARTVGGFALAAVLLVAFVVRERRAAHPMLDVTLFRDRRFSRGQRRGDDHLLRVVRLHLPGHPVLPVRPWLRRAVDGRTDPPGCAVDRGRLGGRRSSAPRIGTKIVITGLVLFGSAFLWISTSTVSTPYATVIVPQMS